MANKSRAYFSSDNQDWETPQWIFDLLNAEFRFTLDVCAKPHNAKCKRFFTPEQNGLKQDWRNEVCFMNPPYADLKHWMAKAFCEAMVGATVTCLVPARTDTYWWWENCLDAEIRFMRGRLQFVSNGKHMPATFPTAIIVFYPGIPIEKQSIRWIDYQAIRKGYKQLPLFKTVKTAEPELESGN